jgi:hypothetical protein
MKDSILRELASMAFSGGAEGEAAGKCALELLSKNDLKRYALFLRNEMKARRVTVRTADVSDESIKKTIDETFKGREVYYELDPKLGAGIELEHGDNIEKINIKNIIERAIHSIKENL